LIAAGQEPFKDFKISSPSWRLNSEIEPQSYRHWEIKNPTTQGSSSVVIATDLRGRSLTLKRHASDVDTGPLDEFVRRDSCLADKMSGEVARAHPNHVRQ